MALADLPPLPEMRTTFEGRACLVPHLTHLGLDRVKKARPELHGHQHDAWEICLILSGSVDWWRGEAIYQLHGGDVYITPPAVTHGGVDETLHPCTLLWLNVRLSKDDPPAGLSAKDTARVIRALNAANPTFRATPALETAYRALFDEHWRKDAWSAVRAAGWLRLLLAAVAEAAQQSTPAQPRTVGQAMEWLSAHLYEPPPVEAWARACGMSVGRFHLNFRQAVGMSPHELRTRRRIAHAKRLLQGEQSITSIAHATGFSSSQYFATTFKRITGMTPARYKSTRGRAIP